MQNKTQEAIRELHLNMGSPIYHTYIRDFKVDGQAPKLKIEDKTHRYLIYELPKPLKAGQQAKMEISLRAENRGFTNSGFNREIVHNGTFLNLGIFPSFGYSADAELTSDKYRKKYGLPEKKYLAPPQNDPYGLRTLLFNDDADYVSFEAVVSTVPDQMAVAPGYLKKTWEEKGRRYFHYEMDQKMDLFFNISSAKYALTRDEWKGPKGQKVNIEIYHHPTHHYNLDRFVKSVKVALDYYSQFFSPYQYRQMRILEFPRYAGFAQSFP
ncbi:MAG: M1 family metallopeptidase [Bacteroidia bacterium]|nr:M1 family metallopeptidase [Bacteroidia bacterium]